MDKREEYMKAFDDWFTQGNRLLKIGDQVFLPITIFRAGPLRKFDGLLVYVYDNAQNTYSGWITRERFGEIITEKIPRILQSLGIKPISLRDFAMNLIFYNSQHDMDRTILFSFNQIGTGQFPEWIVEELVRQKLSK